MPLSCIQVVNTVVSLVTIVFISFHSNRTRSNRGNLKEGKFRLDIKRKFFIDDEALEQSAQGGCGHSSSGCVQGHVG